MKTQRTETGYKLGDLEATGLSPRECQILVMRGQGLREKECARELGCSVANIKNRTANIFYKLQANNMNAAIVKAIRVGYLKVMTLCLVFVLGTNATVISKQTFARNGNPHRTQLRQSRRRNEYMEAIA